MKKVLIIRTSARKGGNSDLMADAFEKGASESGHEVTNLHISDYEIGICKGCYYCEKAGECFQKDYMEKLLHFIQESDVIVFATPIYFYSMSGQMKVLLDRTMPLYFKCNEPQDIYLLASCESTQKSALDGAIKGIRGWISCFQGKKLAGVAYGLGVAKLGAIAKKKEVLEETYQLGKRV